MDLERIKARLREPAKPSHVILLMLSFYVIAGYALRFLGIV